MKIIILESQLKYLMPESYDEDRLNHLLDKINALGMGSLTDKEKITLNNISNGKSIDDDNDVDVAIEKDNGSHYDSRDDEDSYSEFNDVMDSPHGSSEFDRPISPTYLDRGDGDNPSEPFDDNVDLHGMFMYLTPEFQELSLNGDIWYVQVVESNDHEKHIHVANENLDFYVTPFWESRDHVEVETNDGKSLKYKLHHVPGNEKEMKGFIDSFYRNLLPKIIKKIEQL